MKQTMPWPDFFHDAALGHAEEAHVQVIEALALGRRGSFCRPVGVAQFSLLLHRHAREAIIGGIAEDDEDGRFLLYLVGGFPLLLEFGKEEMLLGLLGRFPAGKGISEIDSDAFFFCVVQRQTEALEEQASLKVCDNEWSGQEFEAEDAFLGGFLGAEPG